MGEDKEKYSLKDVFTRYGSNTTAHAPPKVVESRTWFGKIFWLLVFAFGLSMFSYQTYLLFSKYFQHGTSTSIDLKFDILPFPAVTVCNQNQFQWSKLTPEMTDLMVAYLTSHTEKLQGGRPIDSEETVVAETIDAETTAADVKVTEATSGTESSANGSSTPSTPADPVDPDLGIRRKRSSSPISDFYHIKRLDLSGENITWFDDDGEKSSESTIRTNLTSYLSQLDEEVKINMGHRIEDMLQECTFQGYSCSPSDFLLSYNGLYGNCFTFNHGVNETVANISNPGAAYGLSLTLYVNQNDYVPILSQQAGLRVLLHRQDEVPLPDERGFDVSVGAKTSVTVKYITVSRLGEPYSECTQGEDLELLYPGGYTQISCRRTCLQQVLERMCGCVNPNIKAANGTTLCLSDSQAECLEEMSYEILGSTTCTTMCPLPCDESKYDTKTSVTVWPSSVYLRSLGSSLKERGPEFKSLFKNPEEVEDVLRANFLKVEIYYDSLNFERYNEIASYDGSNLIGDIGGQLGLWVGMSIVSGAEILELIAWMIQYWIYSLKKSRGNSVTSLNSKQPIDQQEDKWAHAISPQALKA